MAARFRQIAREKILSGTNRTNDRFWNVLLQEKQTLGPEPCSICNSDNFSSRWCCECEVLLCKDCVTKTHDMHHDKKFHSVEIFVAHGGISFLTQVGPFIFIPLIVFMIRGCWANAFSGGGEIIRQDYAYSMLCPATDEVRRLAVELDSLSSSILKNTFSELCNSEDAFLKIFFDVWIRNVVSSSDSIVLIIWQLSCLPASMAIVWIFSLPFSLLYAIFATIIRFLELVLSVFWAERRRRIAQRMHGKPLVMFVFDRWTMFKTFIICLVDLAKWPAYMIFTLIGIHAGNLRQLPPCTDFRNEEDVTRRVPKEVRSKLSTCWYWLSKVLMCRYFKYFYLQTLDSIRCWTLSAVILACCLRVLLMIVDAALRFLVPPKNSAELIRESILRVAWVYGGDDGDAKVTCVIASFKVIGVATVVYLMHRRGETASWSLIAKCLLDIMLFIFFCLWLPSRLLARLAEAAERHHVWFFTLKTSRIVSFLGRAFESAVGDETYWNMIWVLIIMIVTFVFCRIMYCWLCLGRN